MIGRLAAFFMVLALAVVVPAHAQQEVPASIEVGSLKVGEYRADAMQLAKTTMPSDAFRRMMEASIVNGFRMGGVDSLAALNEKHSGIIAEIETAIVQSAQPHIARMYEDLTSRYARLFSRTMTASETAELRAFYMSPLGQKFIAKKFGHLSAPAAFEGLVDQQELKSTDLEAMNRRVALGVIADMTTEDFAALTALMKTPIFKKMESLAGTINKLETSVGNEPAPAFEEAIATAVEGVLKRRGAE